MMKNSFNADAINLTIQRALSSAGLNTASGPMHRVTEIIKRALASAGLRGPAESPQSPQSAVPTDAVIDVVARVVNDGDTAPRAPCPTPSTSTSNGPAVTSFASESGTFTTHAFSSPVGERSYKLYVPARLAVTVPGAVSDTPQAVVVMLHGCTQSADDFAAGTQMNRLADEVGFLVVYPEQAARANASKCWNWFQPQDQARDAGEPALIAGIVRQVVAGQGAGERRVFVVGLSAGAAMALVMAQAYPEMIAGVGAHSGLPLGSAHDIPTALAAMKGGRSGLTGKQRPLGDAQAPRGNAVQPVPTIVFHGDRDHTVQHSNGVEIIRQSTSAFGAASHLLAAHTQDGVAPGGRRYSRTVYANGSGHALVESWSLHGADHAWSGGDASGTYTDSAGPDASAEMLRFFLALPRAGA